MEEGCGESVCKSCDIDRHSFTVVWKVKPAGQNRGGTRAWNSSTTLNASQESQSWLILVLKSIRTVTIQKVNAYIRWYDWSCKDRLWSNAKSARTLLFHCDDTYDNQVESCASDKIDRQACLDSAEWRTGQGCDTVKSRGTSSESAKCSGWRTDWKWYDFYDRLRDERKRCLRRRSNRRTSYTGQLAYEVYLGETDMNCFDYNEWPERSCWPARGQLIILAWLAQVGLYHTISRFTWGLCRLYQYLSEIMETGWDPWLRFTEPLRSADVSKF